MSVVLNLNLFSLSDCHTVVLTTTQLWLMTNFQVTFPTEQNTILSPPPCWQYFKLYLLYLLN